MKTTTETGIDKFLKMFRKASAVCLDKSVVMPQDAAEQGSREANEPNAVRDVMAAVDGLKLAMSPLAVLCIYETDKKKQKIFYKMFSEFKSISEQLSKVAEKLNRAAK